MQAFLLQRIDDLASSNIHHVSAVLVADGGVLDMSGLLRRSLFPYDGKFWCVTKDLLFQLNALAFTTGLCD